ncbi:hypothetical protein D3C72_2521980 [compost metagenome]
MRQGGFAHARHVFDEQVAAREKAGHAVGNLGRFAHNDRVKLNQKLVYFCVGVHAANHTVKPP